MHTDHDMFVEGIERQRRLKVTYLSDERREKPVRRCGPLYYSRGKAKADELECYYFWDFEAGEGHNFMALSPSEIVGMELTEDSFRLEDIHDSKTAVGSPGEVTESPGS